jgi:hypothetical protein
MTLTPPPAPMLSGSSHPAESRPALGTQPLQPSMERDGPCGPRPGVPGHYRRKAIVVVGWRERYRDVDPGTRDPVPARPRSV